MRQLSQQVSVDYLKQQFSERHDVPLNRLTVRHKDTGRELSSNMYDVKIIYLPETHKWMPVDVVGDNARE